MTDEAIEEGARAIYNSCDPEDLFDTFDESPSPRFDGCFDFRKAALAAIVAFIEHQERK